MQFPPQPSSQARARMAMMPQNGGVGLGGQQVRRNMVDRNDVDEMCKRLTDALRQIHERSHSTCSFQQLHSSGYNLVQHQQGDVLYTKIRQCVEECIREQNELVKGAVGTQFLAVLDAQWKRHLVTTEKASQMLLFFNKNYCLPQNKLSTRDMAMSLYGDILLKDPNNFERFRVDFLNVVKQERDGELVPQKALLTTLSKMLLEVDARGLFETLMEEPFLTVSREFYRAEAAELMATASTPQFVEQLHARLREEKERVDRYLIHNSLYKIFAVLREEYLDPHKVALLGRTGSGCIQLLSSWRTKELHDLYVALEFAKDVPLLLSYTKTFLLSEGDNIVQDPQLCQNPSQFVEKLIGLKHKIDELVQEIYTKQPNEAVDKLVESEMWNIFSQITNKNSCTPDYLSNYLDQKLRSQVTTEEFEVCCDNVMTVFRFLNEKDMFENSYKYYLSRRLLGAKRNAETEDMEQLMVVKLKKECGNQITNKIEGMFNDRRTSAAIAEEFKEALSKGNHQMPIGVNVTVLTCGFWPSNPPVAMRLPESMEVVFKAFKSYYLSRHQGRKLDCQLGLGTIDLLMHLHNRKYELNLPTTCSCALGLFEGDAVWTPQQVSEHLGLEISETVKALAALIRTSTTHAPLLRPGSAQAAAGTLTPATPLHFNNEFKSKHLKIRISAVVINRAPEGGKEGGAGGAPRGKDKVDDDRKHKLDAAIVRIMKSRRMLQHAELVEEVQKVTKKMFLPTMEEIKKRIETLIEREFLERSEETRSLYLYKA